MSSAVSEPPAVAAPAVPTKSAPRERLFTPQFFVMCGFNFTVFLSAMQLLPTAPLRIVEVGGTEVTAGLFIGFLTIASAFSAPLTGAIADRIGRPRTLLFGSLAIFCMSVGYSFTTHYQPMLAIVLVHGVFWSGLLNAGGAYATDLMPASRRAEGITYYGLATTLATSTAPGVGVWIYGHGGWPWLCASIGVLNLLMAAIAWRLPEVTRPRPRAAGERFLSLEALEWRVTVAAGTLFLISFGYGGIMSFMALFTQHLGILPLSLFFSVMAVTMLCTRPITGPLTDRLGVVRVLVPALIVTVLGYALLSQASGKASLVLAGIVFGAGYGSAYTAFAAYVLSHVAAERRAAAFGGILAALDTGIGVGSITLGWIVHRQGFHVAYATAACLATLSIPYFLLVGRRMLRRHA
jgi:MFS family permease